MSRLLKRMMWACAVLTVLATVGAAQAADTTPPVLSGATATPNPLPAAQTFMTLRVTVADTDPEASGVRNLHAQITQNGTYNQQVAMGRISGDESNGTYEGGFIVPSNTSAAALRYEVLFVADDQAGNQATSDPLEVVQPTDNVDPVLSELSVTPASLPAAGGTITVRVRAADLGANASGLNAFSLLAALIVDDRTSNQFTLFRVSGDDSDGVYENSFRVESNQSGAPRTYRVVVRAIDGAGNQASLASDVNIVEAADRAAPILSEAMVSPTSLAAVGGNIAVKVRAADLGADAAGVARVLAVLYLNDSPGNTVLLDRTSGDESNGIYEGTILLGSNSTAASQTYRVVFRATDNANNERALVSADRVLVANDSTGPSLSDDQVSPPNLPAASGPITVQVRAADTSGIGGVIARMFRGDVQAGNLGLAQISGDEHDGIYEGTITPPANETNTAQSYRFVISAQDRVGNQTALASAQHVVVAGDPGKPAPVSGPTLSDDGVTPPNLTAEGGTINLHIRAVSTAGVSTIGATLFRDGVFFTPVSLNRVSGDEHDGIYEGGQSVNPNTTGSVQTYQVVFSASDVVGNQSALASGQQVTVVRDASAPVLSEDAVTPTSFPALGGPVHLKVRAADLGPNAVGVSQVAALILIDGVQYPGSVNLTRTSGDGLDGVYEGEFQASINATPDAKTYEITYLAFDRVGNVSSLISAQQFIVPGDPDPPVQTNAFIGATTLPATGGEVPLRVTVSDVGPNASGLPGFTFVEIFRDGIQEPSRGVFLTRASGDEHSGVYEGSFTVPSNNSRAPRTNQFVFQATDLANNISTLVGPHTVTVANDRTPPLLTDPLVGPNPLTAAGGPVVLRVDAVNIAPNHVVFADLFRNGVFVSQVHLTRVSGDQENGSWRGSYEVPANPSAAIQVYTIVYWSYDPVLNRGESEPIELIVGSGSSTTTVSVTAITANRGGDTGRCTVSVHGTGFRDGATVRLVHTGQPDIVGNAVVVDDTGRSLKVTFDLVGRLIGAWDVVVTNLDGTSASLLNGFTIEPGRDPRVWVDILARPFVRPNTPTTIYLLYGNTGNINGYVTPIWIDNLPGEVDATLELGFTLLPPPDAPAPAPPASSLPIFSVKEDGTRLLAEFVKAPAGSSVAQMIRVTPRTLRTIRPEISANSPLFTGPLEGQSLQIQQPPGQQAFLCTKAAIDFMGAAAGLIPGFPCASSAGLFLNDVLANFILDQDNPRETAEDIQFSTLQFFVNGAGVIATCIGDFSGYERIISAANLFVAGIGLGRSCFPDLTAPRFGEVMVIAPSDPNGKAGSLGKGLNRYLSGDEPLRYIVYFENKPEATAPAQEVVVNDQLDTTKVDVNTFSFGPIAFGDKLVVPPPDLSEFTKDVDLRPSRNLVARVRAKLDKATGRIEWRFSSLDPASLLPTDDPLAGFLPPNVNAPEGEGSVLYTVKPLPNLPSGTEIRNRARIVFDTEDPIDTDEWFNTIDNTKPTSRVLPLPATQSAVSFPVSWAGTDPDSGIHSYSIYVSVDDGPFQSFLLNTNETSATFAGEPGHTYAFYSIAQDNTGNLEESPEEVDAMTSTSPCPSIEISNASASPALLAPPNHKMVAVTVNYAVSDPGATCSLSVSSNEPISGTGEGDLAPDWVVLDNRNVLLRSERAESGTGRVYTITITCVNGCGNRATRSVTVRVPHDQSPKKP